MALRHNHYDAAFEEYLRSLRLPHVVVDERRRTLLAEASLKSLDFLVYSSRSPHLLVDVKGRRFPTGGDASGRGGHKWENWASEEDVEALLQWEQVFGAGFRGMLVFAYHLLDPRWRSEFPSVFPFRGRDYAFVGVWADEFRAEMRVRSPKWQTVSLPSRTYGRLRCALSDVL